MIVKFRNRFHVSGFGRRRFPKGVVEDVPDALRPILPKTAVVLPDNYVRDEEQRQHNEELLAADLARAQAESTAKAILAAAGMAGLEDQPVVEEPAKEVLPDEPNAEDERPKEGWGFDGKEYKTEAAMKAAITRAAITRKERE